MSFADLCLVTCDRTTLLQKINLAIKLGYEVIAIDYPYELLPKASKKKSKQPGQATSEPISHNDRGMLLSSALKLTEEELKTLKMGPQPVKILTRITITMKDTDNMQYILSPDVQDYDIVAVRPLTGPVFHKMTEYNNIDIIKIDMETNNKVITRGGLNQGFQRGIHFEIQYSPAIRDSSLKKTVISNAQYLVQMSKGKNIILSSGCERPIELRGPYDVANLGHLFGLEEGQAKNSVTHSCRNVILHSEERKALKAAVSLVPRSEVPTEQKWVLNNLDSIHSFIREEDEDGSYDEDESPPIKKAKS